jgi:AcrR family transcriptional regulator
MAQRRKYELKKRAERLDETRRRITEATVELHATVGPAATKISEIARRAGVERVTVYNHFPDDTSLLAACSEHWQAHHPAPDPSAWLAIPEPAKRLRTGLEKLYAWYRETEPMMANVQRDAESLPALKAVLDEGLGGYLQAVRSILTAPFPTEGRTGERVNAAAGGL